MSAFVKDYTSSCLLVSVEGNIGSGKSTFLDYCSRNPTFEVLQEPIDKWSNVGGVNLLDNFYKDPKAWGYPFQMEVLMSLFGQYTSEPVRPIRMVERSLWSARHCFQRGMVASGALDATTNALLDQFHDTVASHWRAHPHAIVYLTTSPDVSYERLRARGRPEEMNVSL
ncbi:hypothetical protein HA402_009536 [Bradysia odoriphaga]|nr:hypothetical protein HA402_009536 [Bradysia odoriphaga]